MSGRSARWLLRRGALVIASSFAGACAPAVPTPPAGPHIGDEAVVVPYPPPAALPEVIPRNELGSSAVWIDGEWLWDGSTWTWKVGRWEAGRRGMYFAVPQGVRQSDGRLLWYKGAWHTEAEAQRAGAGAKAP